MEIPQLVAHRGYPRRYPENSLEGIEAAIQTGARYIEFDVQITADGVPVLLHDVSLMRTAGKRGRVINMDFEKISGLCVNEPGRFGKRHGKVTLPTLADAVEILRSAPQVTSFVEIKEESLEKHGREKVLKTLIASLAPILGHCVIISYDRLVLRAARAMGAKHIGWIIRAMNEESKSQATELVPDYLFCNYTKLPSKDPAPLWHGPWQWVLYEVTRVKLALELAALGADFIETMAIGEMLKNEKLRSRIALEH